MSGSPIALLLQPEEEPPLPDSPVSDADLVVVAAFAIIMAVALGFDLVRTWWNTNEWRRDARRRRRELR